MIKEAIQKLIAGEDIGYEMAAKVMDEIMSGEAAQINMASYLTAFRMKGETIDEITASAKVMREHGIKLDTDMELLEIVGTGGDGANSFNISTTTAFVVSAAGIPVAKHGNRSVSSKSGAADVLEALNVNIDISPEKSVEILKKIGICFMFAQKYHSAMKYVGPVRKELGIRTVFNILGPLTNPAAASFELMGVYDEKLVEPLARVLSNLGVKRGMVVFGKDSLDEVSLSAPTVCCLIKSGSFENFIFNPEDIGINKCQREEIVGGNAVENAEITKSILRGEKGPKRDAVLINAAAAIYAVKDNISMEEAKKIAEDAIDSGKAMLKLEQFVKLSNEL